MKNASSFNFLFKCEFGLNTFFALACIIAVENSSRHTPSIYWLSPLITQKFFFVFPEPFL